MFNGYAFSFRGQHYGINTKKMLASRVSKNTADVMRSQASADAYASDNEDVIRDLKKLRLLSNNSSLNSSNVDNALSCGQDNIRHETAPPKTASVHTLVLFITQKCNLRCSYCYGNGGEYGTPGIMDRRTAERAVDWFFKNNRSEISRISFFGGEPLLNFPLIQHMTAYAKEKARHYAVKVEFVVITNNTLMDEEKIDFFHKHGFSVSVSFDGPKEIFDSQRKTKDGSSAYDAAVKFLPLLHETIGGKLAGNAVLTKGADPKAVHDEMVRVGFSTSKMELASSSPQAVDTVQPADDTLRRAFKTFFQEAVVSFHEALAARDEESALRAMRQLRMSLPTRGDIMDDGLVQLPRAVACEVGKMIFAVNINGDIYPCHRFVGLTGCKCGNVFSNDALKIAPGLKSESLGTCRSCWARSLCAGGCVHIHMAETNRFDAVSPKQCELIKFFVKLKTVLWVEMTKEDCAWLNVTHLTDAKSCKLDFG